METTANWQVSIKDPLVNVKDVEDIAQCIYIILTTIPGSDPLRSDFGSDITQYIDRPTNSAAPQLSYVVKQAIEKWETRVSVQSVEATIGVATVVLTIQCLIVSANKQISITVTI